MPDMRRIFCQIWQELYSDGRSIAYLHENPMVGRSRYSSPIKLTFHPVVVAPGHGGFNKESGELYA